MNRSHVIFGVFAMSLLAAGRVVPAKISTDGLTLANLSDADEQMPAAESPFPIVMNEPVLQQLYRYTGSAEERASMRTILHRMEVYRPLVAEKLQKYRIPPELMAIPIIESGYKNLDETETGGWGAGLWMFIRPTARAYGLHVRGTTDDRLNEPLATDAAMRYLKRSYARFKNWYLAVISYNIGRARLQQAIDETGTRDPWILIRRGYEQDADYLPKLIAAIVIMKNPGLVY